MININVLAIGASTTCIVFCFIYWLYQKSPNLPPGPWNLPILGSLYLVNPEATHLSLTKLARKYGPIYSMKFGVVKTVVISDIKILRKVFLKDESTGRPPLFILKHLFQNKGISYTTGAFWKEQRKFVINFLNSCGASKVSTNRKGLENLIGKNAQKFIEYVKNQKGTSFDPSDAIANYVSGIASTLFLGETSSEDDQVVKHFFHDILGEILKLSTFGGPLNIFPFLRFFPKFKDTINLIKESIERIHSHQKEIIKRAKEHFNEKEPTSNLIYAYLSHPSKYINSEGIYNPENLRFTMFDLLLGSVVTTVNSNLWLLLYLAKHEDIQDKIRQELDMLQGESPKIGDLPRLPYMEATIAEAARIRTLGALGFPHFALEDIFVDGFKIEKGTTIISLLWAIHMDPKIWEAPEEFRPERFLNDEGKFHQPESFIPFAIGKRMCVGEALARMMISLFVANTLQNFKIRSDCGDVDFSATCGITLTPKPQKLRFLACN